MLDTDVESIESTQTSQQSSRGKREEFRKSFDRACYSQVRSLNDTNVEY